MSVVSNGRLGVVRSIEVVIFGSVLTAMAIAAVPAAAAPPLAQLPGTTGCISDSGSGPCVLGKELDGAIAVAVSPDSRSVYVGSSVEAAIAVFSVDPVTGALAQSASNEGCVSESGSLGACEDGRALLQVRAVAVSPDGRNLYAASLGSSAVAIFDRDPATGEIDQKAGLVGCISQDGTGGFCTDGDFLDQAFDVEVTPDGRHVLVASLSDALVSFERNLLNGELTFAQCLNNGGTGGCDALVQFDAPTGIAVSADGRNVYVAAQASSAVAVLDRNVGTGELSQAGDATACVSETGSGGECEDGEALSGVFDVAVGSNGLNLYAVARSDNAVLTFDRDPVSGDLEQAAGTDGCASSTDGDCSPVANLIDPFGLAVSPDGESVYVAAGGDSLIAVFVRKTNNGLLSQATLPGGCVADNNGSCVDGRALAGVSKLAVSPDGRNVYAAVFTSDAVAAFDRDFPAFDIDGDGESDPLTDGLLVLRYLFGFTGQTLVTGAVDGANCTRCTAPVIEAFLEALLGG
jgi:DNA-binding beta-propeller fold protein YncE